MTARMPTEKESDAYGAIGERLGDEAMLAIVDQMKTGEIHPVALYVVVGGVLRSIGACARVVTNPAEHSLIEQILMAYLRGALRGADGPVHDNGRPFTKVLHG